MTELIKTEHSALIMTTFPDLGLLDRCVEDVQEQLTIRPIINIFGKECHQNRDVQFFSDKSKGYAFAGQQTDVMPLTPALQELCFQVSELLCINVNGILVNRYNSGSDYIGAHSDDERGIQSSKEGYVNIVAISYGTVRNFRIRDKSTRTIVANIPLSHGSIVHMAGKFQREFTHEIPIQKKVIGTRYSFTFRQHCS